MTSSIPNSFSSEDLEAMLSKAAKDITDEQPVGNGPYGDQGLNKEQIEDLAEKVVNDSIDLCNDPLLHKIIMLTLAYRFATWHSNIAERMFENDEKKSGGAWMRDAGKFQAILDILSSIAIGPDDFTCVHYEDQE